MNIFRACLVDCALLASNSENSKQSCCFASDEEPETLEDFIFPTYSLDDNPGWNAIESIFQNPAGDKVSAYFDAVKKEMVLVDSICMNGITPKLKLDAYAVNMHALQVATDTACALLDIDEYVFV